MSKNLSISQVVKLLQVPEATIKRWIKQGVIPYTIHNNQHVFEKETLISWADSKRIYVRKSFKQEKQRQNWHLIPALKRGNSFDVRDCDNIMDVFVNVERSIELQGKQQVSFAELLFLREIIASTAIGRGVAIPQPRFPLEDIKFENPVVHTFFLEPGVDFKAIDDIPVFVLFVLLCSDTGQHLEILAQLTKILRNDDTYQFLKEHPSHDELIERFQKYLGKVRKQTF